MTSVLDIKLCMFGVWQKTGDWNSDRSDPPIDQHFGHLDRTLNLLPVEVGPLHLHVRSLRSRLVLLPDENHNGARHNRKASF